MKFFLVGFMGCGKSTLGKKIAKSLGFDFLDLDRFIESEVQMNINRIFSRFDEETFRQVEHQKLLEVIQDPRNLVVSTGGGTPCFFDQMDLMNKHGVTIYIQMPAKALFNRLNASKNRRPLIETTPPELLLEEITNRLEKRLPFYTKAKVVINGISPKIDAIATQLREEIDL